MALKTPQKTSVNGTTATYFTPTGAAGDTFKNTGTQRIHVKNAHATVVCNVTIVSPGACNFGVTNAAHNITVAVPAAGAERFIGPFDQARFNDADGLVKFTTDTTASVTAAIIE